MALVLADLVMGVAGGLLGGVRRVVEEAPCPCRAHRPVPVARPEPPAGGPSADATAREPYSPADPASGVGPTSVPLGDDREPVTAPVGPTGIAEDSVLHHIALEGAGELPPGPWRWHWVWAIPGRPSGMALVAADGTLVLWSAGGFAPSDAPPDGRPTAELASALAELPETSRAAAGADTLRWELERTRAVADETRRLLSRAAGTVDDEIGRVNRPSDAAGEGDRPDDA